jgi:hypothetical protein
MLCIRFFDQFPGIHHPTRLQICATTPRLWVTYRAAVWQPRSAPQGPG